MIFVSCNCHYLLLEWSLLSEIVSWTLPQYKFLGGTYIFFISLMDWWWGCSTISWYSCCPSGTRCRDTSSYWGHWKSSTGNSCPVRGKNTASRWWWWRNSTPTAPMKNKGKVDERKEIMCSAHCIYTNRSLWYYIIHKVLWVTLKHVFYIVV